jgi:hypothetical protein
MEYYRYIYRDSERWNGVDDLNEKTVVVYGEQGYGDIIQFMRYIPLLKTLNCKVILHIPKNLHRLFSYLELEMLDKESGDLPKHDYNIPSMSLPFVLNQSDVDVPYIPIEEKTDVGYDGIKIGVAWEGNPHHSNVDERNCCLWLFNVLQKETTRLFLLQNKIHQPALTEGCENFMLYSSELNDFMDTAKLINAMDFVVSVDTSVLHLAGAIGKESYGLISYRCDPRWEVKNWYPSVNLIRQKEPGDWEGVFCELIYTLEQKGKI